MFFNVYVFHFKNSLAVRFLLSDRVRVDFIYRCPGQCPRFNETVRFCFFKIFFF